MTTTTRETVQDAIKQVMEKRSHETVLVGNSFPWGLISRRVAVEPIPLEAAKNMLKLRKLASFWGHRDTMATASFQLGVDVAPEFDRPSIVITADGYPSLYGCQSNTVLVLSPQYAPGYRPVQGVEVRPEEIRGWNPVLLRFL